MNRKSSSLHQNRVARKRAVGHPQKNIYPALKQDNIFSIDEEGQCMEALQTTELPKYQEGILSMKTTGTYKTKNHLTEETIVFDADGLFSRGERKSPSVIGLSRYVRGKICRPKTHYLRQYNSDIINSPVSVMDDVLDVMEDEY